jgi:hypothetical protein
MSELTEVLAKGKTLTFAGRDWNIEPLDLNDLADLDARLEELHPEGLTAEEGGAPKHGLDALDIKRLPHLKYVIYLLLRKADPTLPMEYRERAEYKLTEVQVGRMVSLPELKKPETVTFMAEVLRLSGLTGGEEDAQETGAKKRAGRPSA